MKPHTEDDELRKILEKVMNYGYGQCDGGCAGEELTIEQAIKAITTLRLKDRLDELEFLSPWINKGLVETWRLKRIAELKQLLGEGK